MIRHEEEPRQKYTILLPVLDGEEAEELLWLALALLRQRPGQVVLVGVVTVPSDRTLSEGAVMAQRRREELHRLVEQYPDAPLQLEPRVRVAHQPWPELERIIRQEKCDLLLLPWREGADEPLMGMPIDQLLNAAPCAVAVVRGRGMRQAQQILLPVRGGGPHTPAALHVALALADAADATVTLLHAAPEGVRDLADDFFRQFRPLLRGLNRVRREVRVIREVVPTIVEEALDHQVIVLGAAEALAGQPTRLGPVARGVAADTEQVVIVVKAAPKAPAPALRDREPAAASVVTPLSVLVDKWFAENTFHSREFANLEQLAALKEEQGLTISLGLPALNEEKTVGKVIQTVKTALMDEVALLDEVVLIDSGSIDYTREIAADLGIPVYIHQEILPQYGAYHGKGEALWKSLYVLKGDIIAWIDTDIANIHPRFVYGILGPLLRNPRIQYVKGFYRRPLRRGDRVIAGGGGRVTELTARPLINLFFPELSGLIQPLSGEYAGRRETLEQIPFFTGYGVEIGLLIDILEIFGLRGIAQVDLQERIHRNKPLQDLSPMAFAIIQVVVRRLEDRHKIRLMEDVNKTMNLIRYELNHLHLETREIREYERPPMITLPEYREKHSSDGKSVRGSRATMEAAGS